jgi:hypothetical protein
VLAEGLAGGVGEFLGGAAGGVQLQEQGLGLAAKSLLDQRELAKVFLAEERLQPLGPGFDVALAPGWARPPATPASSR